MPLKLEHVTSFQINWHAKSDNLKDIAVQLSLGLDSFIMLDDSPLECAEIQARCPEVLTICLTRDVDRIPSFLSQCWAFHPPLLGVPLIS